MTTITEEGEFTSVDRLDNVHFGRIRRRSSDGLYVAKLVGMSTYVTANVSKVRNIATGASDHAKGWKAAGSWHLRLEHTNKEVIKIITNSGKYGMTITNQLNSRRCQTCMMTKLPKRKYTGQLINGFRTATIHVDICGPMKLRS